MTIADQIPIGSTLIASDGVQEGQFIGLNFSRKFQLTPQAETMAIDFQDWLTVANNAALTALDTVGLAEGAEVYVKSYRSNFRLQFDSLTLRPHEVLASSATGKVWVRDIGPSSWTYQYVWYYNKDTGNDENDGASKTTPIQSLDEWCRRMRVYSAGVNGTQTQYNINLQTDVAATDSWFPSGIIQADGVQIGQPFGETLFAINMVGFRHAVAVPGGSGLMTAAAALSSVANRTKGTFTDSLGVFTTLRGQMVMAADTATAASGTGVVASITAAAGIATLTGGTGFITGSVNRMVIISGAATAANNGAFPITEYISATSIKYSNPGAVTDANNGAISWTEKPSKMAWIVNAPAFTTGSFSGGVTAVSAGIATLAGAPGGTFTSASVGKRIRLSGNLTGANNVEATIVEFVSATSVKIANSAAVADASATTYQGVVEIGTSWFDTATLSESAAAPSSGSPYAVIQLAVQPLRSWGAGLPRGLVPVYIDCDMTNNAGIAAGADIRLVTSRVTGWSSTNGAALSAGRTGVQSLIFGTLSCWVSPSNFGSYICAENGYQRWQNCSFVDYNILLREIGPQITSINSLIQGGFIGLPGNEAGGRIGALGLSVGGTKGLGVFNNIDGSATNPSVASGSAGGAVILGRNSRMITAGSTGPQGAGKFWGVGALIGMHVKEKSLFVAGLFGMPTVTDSPGQAGFPVQEVKIDAQAPIPVSSATTGVPTAVTTTSGAATTFVALNGIVTLTDAGAVFSAASVGRTVTIAGANTAANNGTYPIESFIGATSVTIRNPAGVTDAVSAGTMTENSVITRWSQLWAAPYSGNAVNHATGSSIIRVTEA